MGNDVNFVGHNSNAKRTYIPFGGREFVLNPDGTVKAKFGNHLVLGVDPPDCTLVPLQNVGNKLVIEPQVAQALRNGQAAPLTLASHPGYAIVPKTEQPRRFAPAKNNYQQLGVGPAATVPMIARLEGAFLVSHHTSTMNYVFDIPFGSLVEHCHGKNGKQPIAAISFDHGNAKEEGNAARLFVLNADDTISPQRASNLVFGIRGYLPGSGAGAAVGASAATQMMMVTVPPGLVSGQMFVIQTPSGQQMQVAVPPGVGAGQQIQVSMPKN